MLSTCTHVHMTMNLTEPFSHADPPGVAMYKDRKKSEGNMTKWLCYRGTSSLEGYHNHLGNALPIQGCSPLLANALTTRFNFRYAVAAGIRNNNEPDFGHFKYPLMDKIHSLCTRQQWEPPMQGYKPLWKSSTTELFGVDHVRVNMEDTDNLPPSSDATMLDELFLDSGDAWEDDIPYPPTPTGG